jgi:uncharacterized repeat protein (TIGR01451 family)
MRLSRSLLVLALVGPVTGCVSSDGSAAPVQHAATAPAPEPAKPAPPQAGGSSGRLAYPTGDTSTSAVLLEKVAPAEVSVGQPLAYMLRVTNLTDMTLQNVVVTDRLGGNFKLAATKPATSPSADGALRWSFATLAPRAQQVIEVTGAATGPGSVSGCAEITYASTLCVTTLVVEPRLELVKQAPAEVLACDPIPLRFTVTNRGTGAARDVRITDQLPDGLVTQDGLKAFTLDAGTLAAGQSRELSVSVKAQRPGTYVNRASAAAAGGLSAESGTTTTRVLQPVLQLAKDGPRRQFAGRSVTWTLTVTNTGDGPARNLVLEDTLPAGATFERASEGGKASGGRVTWSLGTLEPKGSRKVEVTVMAANLGTLRNTATARAECATAVAATAETAIEGIPAILLEVVDDPDPIELGNTVTYTITVTNQGSATDTNVRVTCALDKGMQYVSSSGPTAATATGAAVTFAPLAALQPKQQVSWKIVVRAGEEGDVRFGVQMKSDKLTRSVDETEATNFYR